MQLHAKSGSRPRTGNREALSPVFLNHQLSGHAEEEADLNEEGTKASLSIETKGLGGEDWNLWKILGLDEQRDWVWKPGK